MREPGPGYAVLGRLIIDDLVLADGAEVPGLLGGAGFYAALGAATAGERPAGLISGIGRDLGRADLDRLDAWGIVTTALRVEGERTPRSRVVYRADGERSEIPLLGLDHFASMAPRIADIPADWGSLRGLYLFAGVDPRDWDGVIAHARAAGCPVLWEISADVCDPDHFHQVSVLLREVDIFSVNLTEARGLCGVEQPADCAAMLAEAGAARVSLRMGAAGTILCDGGELTHVGVAPSGPVVDPTGAGNSHSGALLAAFVDTGDLVLAARRAAAAASLVIEQYGPPAAHGPARAELLEQRTALTPVTHHAI
ncbi:carbohydrate kinase family protein [Nonomuraea antimicrobica]